MRCRYPHGLGGLQPPAGCFASGENEKRRRENAFSRPSFFTFSVCPWDLLRSLLSLISVSKQIPLFLPSYAVFYPSGRKKFVCTYYYFAYWVQGGSPCRRGAGGEKPPASSRAAKFSARMGKKCGKRSGNMRKNPCNFSNSPV